MDLTSSIRDIKGVGEKTEQLFQKIGVYTVGDILLHFPRTYQEYPDISLVDEEEVGGLVALQVFLKTPAVYRRGRNMDITTATAFDRNQMAISCVWFRMPYIGKSMPVGSEFILFGKLIKDGYTYKLEQPAVFTLEQYKKIKNNLQPIYSSTKGLNQNAIRKVVAMAFDEIKEYDFETDILPKNIVVREDFFSHEEALRGLHFPVDFEELKKSRRRLVYEEFFYFILQSRILEKGSIGIENTWEFNEKSLVYEVVNKLPYELTKGQRDTLHLLLDDLRGPTLMQRLIQGDVGSGKTIVAFLAMLDVVSSGHQAAIMAPTEVLAMQHAQSFRQMCEDFSLPYSVVLLTGSMTAAQKKKAYEVLANENSLFVVGTHALIQEKVSYLDLALVITDEQHRFGVRQRENFSKKGKEPHMLVMSATPIPRTLAMILYGNMKVSIIKDMPAERKAIKTCVIKEKLRKKSYEMIAGELDAGHQAYIICPLVEASENTEAQNVTDYAKNIRGFFENSTVIKTLHGKMKASEKNKIMEDFARGEIDILVSTTVVEVGVNVPNATVIMIENANRFGLAQLHQLRGRVGRGDAQSYCILMDGSKGSKITPRLEVMNKSHDGFYIAEEDLKLRGPGDFFGIRQSGELGFRLADIIGDAEELKLASSDVDLLLDEDPDLEGYPAIKEYLSKFASTHGMIL